MTRCAMHRAVLSARELSYAIAGRTLLDAVTLSLEEGERVALVGDNGAGKSTLLALLVGELPADGGEVRLAGAARIGLLSQEPRLDPGASVLDVVRSGLGEHDALLEEHTRLCHENAAQDEVSSARIVELTERIEAGAGFDVEHRVEEVLSRLSVTARVEKVSSLSGGERRRVDLARLLLEAPDVLLLDEPTNHLDAAAVSWLAEHLKARRGALLFTSHDRAFIDVVTTGILELDEGKLFKHDPPYASFVEGRMMRKDTEGRSADKRKRMMARELAWLRAGTPARTTKQNARIERAEALIDEVKHDVERRRQKSAELVRAKSQRLANTILELRAVTVAFGDRVLVDNLTLTLVEGERWGLVGPNGAGKTSLLRVVTGELAPTSGSVVRGGKTRFGLFDQHRRSLDPDATLDEVLADGGDWVTVDEEKVHVCTYLERYLFRGDDRKRKVSTLSGGEQNRLLLAKLLKQGANCLLLDEPTNDLDVSTLGLLEDALLDHPGVALIVSHDRSFLDRVCTGILAFEGNRVVPYQGDYSTYLRLKAGQEAREAESSEPSSQRPSSSSSASDGQAAAGSRGERKKKRSFKEEREYERIEQDVLVAEARREELSALLQGSAGTDASRAGALAEELAAIEAEVERLYARWQELEGYGG